VAKKAGLAPKSFRRRWVLTVVLALVLGAGWNARPSGILGQERPKSTIAANPGASRGGEALFRVNCAGCHGLDARGGSQGPDLTSSRAMHGESDAALIRTITKGVPATTMPANDLSERETRMVIAYVRALSAGAHVRVTGDREKGKSIFYGKGNCSSCHMVNGHGGRLGPDLSGVGASRSIQYLMDSIREPSKELTEGMGQLNSQFESPAIYETVTVVTQDGQRIIGVPKNEDNFSLQLLDVNEELHLFLKKDLKEVTHERKSLMPPYTESAISKTELQDLLAYLLSLYPNKVLTGEQHRKTSTKAPNK
jgi:cytochrome c oxidase cbb3-type subunit III